MTSNTEKSYLNLLLKKIQNAPYTNNNVAITGEAPGSSQINIQPSQIWNQDIPNQAPALGTATIIRGTSNNYLYTVQNSTNYSYIKYYSNVLLSSTIVNNAISFIYAGSLNGQIPTTNLLINTIPFSQGSTGSYGILLQRSSTFNVNGSSSPTDLITMSSNDSTYPWYFDVDSGYLTFLNGAIQEGWSLFLSFWRYEGTTGFNNDIYNWNSQSISSFYPNTYYLLANMGDFSNNYGSINITGSIGGKNGTNMAVINSTIVTSGNIATPSIIGSIENYNNINSPFCDIVVYYDNSSNNYQSTTKITDISGVIYDSSNIFFNSSNTLIDVNKIITGLGIDNSNTIINSYDNSNNLSINTITNSLTRPSVDISSVGFVLNNNTFIIQNNSIPSGYFLDLSSISTYSKPFISSRNNNTYTTPNNILNITSPLQIPGFIQNRGGNSYLITSETTNYTNFILYYNASSPIDISNAPIITTTTLLKNTSYTLSRNGSPSIQNNSSNIPFYGYTTTGRTTLITNKSNLTSSHFITDNSNGDIILDGTINNGNLNNNPRVYGLSNSTNPGLINPPIFTNISGGIHRIGDTYYFVYTNIDPSINNFIVNTTDASFNIRDTSCIFLNELSNNKYVIDPSSNLSGLNLTALSRFGVSGERVPYYIVDGSNISIPLINSNYQNFNITGDIKNDIMTFGGNTLGRRDGFTLSASGDYLVDNSLCRYRVKINESFTYIDVSSASATITNTGNYTSGTSIAISSVSGTITPGQFISIESIPAYFKSSIRVRTYTTSNMTLDFSLNVPANTRVHFYTPQNNLNIIKSSNFQIYKGYQLFSYTPITYSLYNQVNFSFYQPKNYSLNSIIDTSNGVGIGPKYSIYLLTNKDGNNSNGYFNLSITGKTSNNIIYPFSDISSNPPPDNNIVIKSICDSVSSINNSFKTTYNTISNISTNDLSSSNVINIVTPIRSTYDGSNIQMTLNSSYSSLTITDPNLIRGISIRVVIQCSTNQVGISNNLYFGLGYNFSNPLYTSIPLSLASTTYIANITIPENRSGSINLYIYASPVTTGNNLNTMFIQNLSISKLDTFTTGYVGIGKSTPVTMLDVSGDIQANSYNALSDYRLKENIVAISDTSFSIDLLKPVYYIFKSSQKQDLGFLAHEVQEEIPFLVNGKKDGENMQSLNYNGFIALLVKEIQDLKKENREIKERIDRIEK